MARADIDPSRPGRAGGNSSGAAPVLLTGATGHVGGALLERLLGAGRRVRCVVRDPQRLGVEHERLELVEADLRDGDALGAAFEGVGVVYFLVHALSAGGSLEEEERTLAANVADAAAAAGAARIVYLGGLVDEDDDRLSPHMASRVEAGRVLRESGVQTIELRASIVVGEGSFSFELIRKLVDLLPVLVLPDWIDNLAQPIALGDVVTYLERAADVELEGSACFEIGGADRVTYRELIEEHARQVDSATSVVTVPASRRVLAAATRLARPALDALPGEAQETLKLLESLRHTTVVRDRSAERVFGVEPMSAADALRAVNAG